MPIRTDVLVHEEKTMGNGTLVTVATVPTDEVWLIRQATIDNRTGSAITGMLLLLRSSIGVKWAQEAVATSGMVRLSGLYFVAEDGDVIQGLSTVAGAVRWGLYGSRLVQP